MSISASQVKELREITGSGIMDCKVALAATNGDMSAAVSWLRKKGITRADQKAKRIAADGLIGIMAEHEKAVLVEVNTETDFVARNDFFQDIVRNVAQAAFEKDGSLEAISLAICQGSSRTIADIIRNAVDTLGENIRVRRVAMLHVRSGVIATYIHNSVSEGLGKIGVLVALETTGNKDAARTFGRQVAMHVAAKKPLALTIADLDPAFVEQEKEFFLEQAHQSGKPKNIIDKIVNGRLHAFYQEVVLLSQAFVINPDHSVEEALKQAERSIGAPAKIVDYVCFTLGEGIEKVK
ncbi:MAG: elongation factor Ts [Candidatus Tokpelaia sp. JSC085]|nr:MAG: elongation factor Ts [Candidatus Tokpelaia sp. JSC085]